MSLSVFEFQNAELTATTLLQTNKTHQKNGFSFVYGTVFPLGLILS